MSSELVIRWLGSSLLDLPPLIDWLYYAKEKNKSFQEISFHLFANSLFQGSTRLCSCWKQFRQTALKTTFNPSPKHEQWTNTEDKIISIQNVEPCKTKALQLNKGCYNINIFFISFRMQFLLFYNPCCKHFKQFGNFKIFHSPFSSQWRLASQEASPARPLARDWCLGLPPLHPAAHHHSTSASGLRYPCYPACCCP